MAVVGGRGEMGMVGNAAAWPSTPSGLRRLGYSIGRAEKIKDRKRNFTNDKTNPGSHAKRGNQDRNPFPVVIGATRYCLNQPELTGATGGLSTRVSALLDKPAVAPYVSTKHG